jgi:hypothetical protein
LTAMDKGKEGQGALQDNALPHSCRERRNIRMDRRERERGQSLVEFALCLMILILIFLGVFDLGRAFHSYVGITNAAREGARYGSMHPEDTSGIKLRAVNEGQNSGIVLNLDDVVPDAGSGLSGDPIAVTVTYEFRFITLLAAQRLRGGSTILQLRSRAVMTIY